MNLAQQIQQRRKAKGWTQKQLAQSLNIATGTVQQYELGKRTPKIEMLKLIATALDVTPFDLVGSEWFDMQIGPEKLKVLSAEVSENSAFQHYLESLGYSFSHEGAVNDENFDIILTKDDKQVCFSDDEFSQFQKAISDSIEYQVWQQHNKK